MQLQAAVPSNANVNVATHIWGRALHSDPSAQPMVALATLSVPRPMDGYHPPVGYWAFFDKDGERMLSSAMLEIEDDYNYTPEGCHPEDYTTLCIPFSYPVPSVHNGKTAGLVNTAEAKDIKALRNLETLRRFVARHEGTEYYLHLESGGGANAALFYHEPIKFPTAPYIRSNGHAVEVPDLCLLAVKTGTNMDIAGCEFMGTSSWRASTTTYHDVWWEGGGHKPGYLPQWEDYAYTGSVPSLRNASSAEEAADIVSTLRSVERVKEIILNRGLDDPEVRMLAAEIEGGVPKPKPPMQFESFNEEVELPPVGELPLV